MSISLQLPTMELLYSNKRIHFKWKAEKHHPDSFYGLSNFIEGKSKKKQSHKLIINH